MSEALPLKFGTSGWRAVLADEFTFDNSRRAVAAIAQTLGEEARSGPILIGYDTRFLARAFAEEAARVLASHGFDALVSERPIPTPVLAFEIRRRHACGALNFTASHNPPKYLGLKFSTADGAPALPQVTTEIEKRIAAIDAVPPPAPGSVSTFDPVPAYLESLAGRLAGSRIEGLSIALDFRFGTSAGFLDRLFFGAGAKLDCLHANADPLFGGSSPQCSEGELSELARTVRASRSALGLATDGDADRFGVLDERGRYVPPNAVLALVADDLFRRTGSRLGIARSVATTHALDEIAARHSVTLHETPVGFKYIGELLLAGKIAFGGEESAGLTIVGHVPEKDGILADALVARLVADSGKPITGLLADLEAAIGPFRSSRVDVALSESSRVRLEARRRSPPDRFATLPVERVNDVDGLKLLLPDGAWVLARASGTEPVARFYAEARSDERLAQLLAARSELF